MKTIKVIAAIGFLVSAVPGWSQAVISHGHVDLGVLYEEGTWDLHVHKETPPPDEEFAPGDAIIQLGPKAALAGGVPNNAAATGFFGAAGSPLWILPKAQDPDLPFFGIGAEEMSPDDWVGSLTLKLDEVRGPGNVFIWDVGAFGELEPKMSSRDGISASDVVGVEAGSHGHYFWAFSAPGDYEVSFSASGTHKVDGAVASDPVAYRFQVVPEPGVGWLLVVGGLCLSLRRGRSCTCG